jgi:hypothetical protein
MASRRTLLQDEADTLDLNLYRLINKLEGLADRTPVAASKLRGVAIKLRSARPELRALMHAEDRKASE